MTSGENVLDRAVDEAVREFGPSLSGAYALGSLAHGGFAPLVSDVDLMLVLDAVEESTRSRVDVVRERVRRDDPSELADRLSVFWADWPGVRAGVGPHGRLPEVDRLDLLDSGRLLHGQDRRNGAERPEAGTIVRQAAEFAVERFDDRYVVKLEHPELLVDEGPRSVTKAVLFPVRFLYTLATGHIGRNDDASDWFGRHHHGGELVTAAMAWRAGGIADPAEARRLMAAHLVPIHTTFATRYVRALEELGYGNLAARLDAWGARFDANGPGA